MIAANKEIGIRISAQNDTEGGLRGAVKSLENWERGLKAKLGPRSLLKDLTEIAVGGGAVAGVSFLGRELANASAKAVELSEAFHAGKISAGAMAEELARAAPLIGGYISFGRDLRELFTHEEQYAREAAEQTQKMADASLRYVQNIKLAADYLRESKQNVALTNESTRLENIPNQDLKSRRQLEIDHANKLAAINETADKRIRQLKGENAATERDRILKATIDQENAEGRLFSVRMRNLKKEQAERYEAISIKAAGEIGASVGARIGAFASNLFGSTRARGNLTETSGFAQADLRTGITGVGNSQRASDPALEKLDKNNKFAETMSNTLSQIYRALAGAPTI